MMKFENYERMKLRIVHEALIKEEKIPTIFEIIKRNMIDLNEIIQLQKQQVQREGGHFDLQPINVNDVAQHMQREASMGGLQDSQRESGQ